MSTPLDAPSPARDLVRIHKVITRSLKVSLEKAAEFQQGGFPSQQLQEGFCDYSRCLTTLLEAHHLAEDEVFFPALKTRLPQGPYAKLASVHREIADLVPPVNRSIDTINAGGSVEGFTAFQQGLEEIRELWGPHMRMEESIFSHEALSEVMSPEEMASLSAQMGKFSSEHSSPAPLVIPFVLFNQAPEERRVFIADLPPALMDDLVMKAWKDQWAVMKPFLLD